MSFFAELKRRNVFKVGVAYVIVAWLIAQVIDVINEPLHLPDWFGTVVIILLGIGFLLAIFLAWVYELTPEGIKVTTSAGPAQFHTQTTGQRLNYFIIGVLVLAVAFLVVDNYVLKESTEVIRETPGTTVAIEITPSEKEIEEKTVPIVPPNSIAVLPFTNMSEDKANEYFADGIAEEILNSLARIKELEVRGRTSSFYFKDKNDDLDTISKMLNVEYILEGSVRKAGNQVRITVQLINALKDEHLWSKTYDRTLDDIFAVQEDIAESVATALSVTLGAGAFSRPGMTRNIEAYEEYLRGMANYYKYTPDSILNAISELERTVTIDPNFAKGWLELSNVYSETLLLRPEQTVDFRTRSADAMEHARTIAPNMPELLTVTAQENRDKGNWLEADHIYQQLLSQYGHSNAEVNREYGRLLMVVGRSQEALTFLQRAQRLDPLDSVNTLYLPVVLLHLKRYEEALAETRRGLTFDSLKIFFNADLWLIPLNMGDRSKAAAVIEEVYGKGTDNPDEFMLKMAQLLVTKDTESALSELQRMADDSALSVFNKTILVTWVAVLGGPQLALDTWHKIGLSSNYAVAFWHPIFSEMRHLAGFKDHVTKAGFVDYWRKTGNWGEFCHPIGDNDFECN